MRGDTGFFQGMACVLLFVTLGAPVLAEDRRSLMLNPVSYFEIPVSDMDRAVDFYEAVFVVKLERTVIDNHEMALFPFDERRGGITGALAELRARATRHRHQVRASISLSIVSMKP